MNRAVVMTKHDSNSCVSVVIASNLMWDIKLREADLGKIGYFTLAAKSRQEFQKLNSGAVFVEVGNETVTDLQESGLLFISDGDDHTRIAKKVASRLKRITKAGPVVINYETGDECIARTFAIQQELKSCMKAESSQDLLRGLVF